MAKVTEKEETGTAVAIAGAQALAPQIDAAELEGLEGLGYSERAEDGLVPILSILQDNSAEVKRQHAKHIPGAEAGKMIIRSLKRVIDTAERPLVVQPCGFQHMWVRWEGDPGEGAVVGQYPFDDRPEEAEERPDPQNPDRTIWYMPDGTRLVDTRYHFCNVQIDDDTWMPIVIPMAGTNHTVSRQWTELMKMHRVNGQRMPAWFRLYTIGTQFNSRGTQSWFTYDIADIGWCGDSGQRAAGRQLFESLQEERIAPDVAGESASAAEDVGNV